MLRRALQRVGALAAVARKAQLQQSQCTGALGCLQEVQARCYATNSHDVMNIHKHSKENDWDVNFDFTEGNYERVAEILQRYPSNYKQSAVIPLLDLAQQQNSGWLPLAAMNKIAEILEMAPIRVYEVATFYTMFNRSPMGKYHVMVCGTTPCMLQGSQGIFEAISKHLGGLHYGETSEDGMFTLGEMECMGACVNAPMIAIADYTGGVEGFSYNYYEDLTPENAVSILKDLQAGKQPKVGSQHRNMAEPKGVIVNGKWVPAPETNRTLVKPPPGPYCRDLDAPEPPKEQAAAAAPKK